MRGTIHTAIAHLPARVRTHLLDQWARCDMLDIYNGDLDKYLLVIEQEMQEAFDALLQTTSILEVLQSALNNLSPSRHGAPKERVILQVRERRVFYLPEHIEDARSLAPGQ